MTCPFGKTSEQAPLDKLKPLAKSAHALGCEPIQRKHLSVILRLNEFGFFRAGGVLIGTHAFLAYANQLGVRWRSPDTTCDSEDPTRFPNLDVALQSLRFMEFSLEDVQQTTLFDATGRCVVVNLPAPQRYAVHKLLIIGERAGTFRVKVSKDLAQAAALMGYFMANDPDALQEAWADALGRGPGWRKRAAEGLKALGRVEPNVARGLEPV